MRWFSDRLAASVLIALLFVPTINAQKKGGGGGSSSAPAATPAATTSPSAPFEVEMLAYGALDKIMDRLAVYACTAKPTIAGKTFSNIVVLDPPALQALQAYDAFTVNAMALASAYGALQGTAAAGSGIDDFSDITNAVAAAAIASTSESSFSFTLQDPTAAIVLLNHLKSVDKCGSAYYAGVYAVNEADKPALHGRVINSVSDQLAGLATLRVNALKGIMDAGQGTTTAARSAAGCAPIPSAASAIAVDGNDLFPFGAQDACLAAFNSLDTSYNTFLQGLSTPNATTGVPALSSILQGFRLRALFASATVDQPLLGVYLNVSAAGGTQQDRKNLFTAIFTGDLVRYSGGVSIDVIVFQIANADDADDDQSTILLSDLIRYRTPLGKLKKPNSYDDAVEEGDNLSKIPENK